MTATITRTLISQFNRLTVSGNVHVSLYRESVGYVYERQLVEARKGTAVESVMMLPFLEQDFLMRFIRADPCYAELRADNEKLLRRLREDMRIAE